MLGGVAGVVMFRAAEQLDVDHASVGASIEGCGPACADAWTRALDERLGRFGLRVAAAPPEDAPIVELSLEPLDTTEGVHEGQLRVRARVTLRLSTGGAPGPLVLDAEAVDRDAALLLIALGALDMRADSLADEILSTRGVGTAGSVLELARADALTRARRAQPAYARAVEAFEARCRQDEARVARPTENVSCVTRCASELRSARATDGSAWVQLRRAAWAIPFEDPRDVQRLDLPGQIARWTANGELEIHGQVARETGAALGSRHGVFAFIAHHERASALTLLDGTERVLKRVEAPRVLARPAPSPSGRWVAFLSAEHRRGVAHLVLMAAEGGATRDLFSYVEDFRWVERHGRELLLLHVGGAELAASPLTRPTRDAGTTDTEGYEDEPDDFDLVEAGDPLAPPGPYAVLLDPLSDQILARVGGRERLVRGVAGLHLGTLIATYAAPSTQSPGECGVLFHDVASAAERIVVTPACLTDPALLPDGSVAASAIVTSEGDPSATDREIVVVSPDGALEVLTANETDDLEPSAVGSRAVAFTRRLPTRYARFPRSAACRATLAPRAAP